MKINFFTYSKFAASFAAFFYLDTRVLFVKVGANLVFARPGNAKMRIAVR